MYKFTHRLSIFLFFVLWLLTGCIPTLEEMSADYIVAALRATGASVRSGGALGELPAPPFSASRQMLLVNGSKVQLYLYADEVAAQADAARVLPDGFAFDPAADDASEPTTIDWLDTPHFFRYGRSILLYVGDDLSTLDYLERALGPQFAGGASTAIPFGVDGEFANGVRYRNLIIHLTEQFGSKGQLTFPPTGDGPWPTVILFSGTGPADMDASYDPGAGQPISTNFKQIAEALGEAGIAVLRFNKRGVLAHGEYDYEQLQQIIVNQRILDAEAAIITAKAQPEVNAAQLFLYGWSEGAIVATYATQAHPDLAGLILQAPLNRTLEEALVYQYVNIALPYLQEIIDQDEDGKLSESEVAAIPAGPVWFLALFSMRTSLLAALLPLPLQPNLDLDNDGLIDIQTELRPFVEAVIPLLARFYAGSTPSQSIAELVPALPQPILLLHGERDGWIPIAAAEEIVAAAPEKVTLIRYPTLGHALSPSERLAEDAFGEMAREPIQDMIHWILRQLPPSGR